MNLKLATGEVINCLHVQRGIASDLIINMTELSFSKATELFSNPKSTEKIIVSLDDEDVIYQGFTTLRSIQINPAFGDAGLMIILQR